MSKMKFALEKAAGPDIVKSLGVISIVGKSPKYSPYVIISTDENKLYYVPDKDLERFAVNILKALDSKKLKKP